MSGVNILEYGSNGRFFRLGRHALLEGFKILKLKRGDKVLFPAFICRDLLAPVHSVGAIPIFYEVSSSLNPIDLPENIGVRAVLAVNYFGFPQELSPFKEYCHRNGCYLIEDNAHGYLSKDKKGKLLGLRGDIGILSIRKTLTIPDGAMLLVNNEKLKGHLRRQLDYKEGPVSINFIVRRILKGIQHLIRVPILTTGKGLYRFARLVITGHAITPLDSKDEYEIPIGPSPHWYSIKHIHNNSSEHEILRRRKLYEKFDTLLSSLNIQPVFKILPDQTVPYGYPFYGDINTVKKARKFANKYGLDCIHWPDLPGQIVEGSPHFYQSLFIINFTL